MLSILSYVIGYEHIPVIFIPFSHPEGYAYDRNAVYRAVQFSYMGVYTWVSTQYCDFKFRMVLSLNNLCPYRPYDDFKWNTLQTVIEVIFPTFHS